MADIVQLSNQRSAIKASLADYTKDVFSYKLGGSVPNCSINKVSVNPQTAATFNSVVRYRLPEWGLLSELFLRLVINWGVTPSAPNVTVANAVDSFSKIELRTHDKVIETLTSHQIHDWISRQSDAERKRHETANLFNGNNSGTGANTKYTVLCPLPFSMLSNLKCLPDLKHTQNVEVFVYFRSATAFMYDSAAGWATAVNMDAETKVLAKYLNPDTAAYSKLLASNYRNRTANHSSIFYSVYEEPVVSKANATLSAVENTITIDLNCNMPVCETRVMVRKLSDTTSATAPKQSDYQPIKSMRITAAGQDVLPTTSHQELLYVDNTHSIGLKGSNVPNVYKYVPTIMAMPRWKKDGCPFDNGALSLQYLNNPQMTIVLDVPASDSVLISIEHTVIQSQTVSAQTGAISTNFSS